MKKSNKDIGDLPIMPKHCKSCPFKDVGGKWQNVKLANAVIERTLFNAQQICHATEGKDREPTHRCKGSFDYNDNIYKQVLGIGFEEWKSKNKKDE